MCIRDSLYATAREAGRDKAKWAPTILERYGARGTDRSPIEVPDLEPWESESSVATVQLVVDETATDTLLGIAAGMPRDLDGDGAATSNDVSANATLLPAIVRLRWSGNSGQQELTQVIYLLRY